MTIRVAYITGAAGFLGSHLVDRFLSLGYHVAGIDNLVTGRRENLETALAHERFCFIEADISRPWSWTQTLAEPFASPTLILHFASPASPVDYGNDPLGTMTANALGTIHACELAERSHARVLLASTSESYGDPLEHPQRETYWGNVNPIGVRACYDESKRFAEAYVTSCVRVTRIDARIVRIFNTYGPRMQAHDGRVVPNFCTSAISGAPLTIYGNGHQTRSFCFVDDLIEGIVRLATRDGLRGEVVNIGNPSEHTISELATIIARLAGVPLITEARALPPDDPTRRRPDIAKAKALLDWEPRVTLEDGLIATLNYFRGSAIGASSAGKT
jgi:nucleoside-diphosphate-sugar epimerase